MLHCVFLYLNILSNDISIFFPFVFSSLQIMAIFGSKFLFSCIFFPSSLTILRCRVSINRVETSVSKMIEAITEVQTKEISDAKEREKALKKEKSDKILSDRKVIPK